MKEPLKGVNTQMADPNEAPTIPQPAATVLLVRNASAGEGIEVFMVERASKANFGGAYVFPGGKVDTDDGLERIENICSGPTDAAASDKLGEEKGGLAYWIACIRECFEEAGILIAYRKDGSPFDPETPEENGRFID